MTMQTLYTGPTAEDLAHIPAALTTRSQWVLWRGADRVDQQTGKVAGLEKIPIDPQTLTNASTTDPETWGAIERCIEALPVALEEWENDDPGAYRGGGIGYVFSHEDPYTGIDLDHCRDPTTRAIADWAQAYIDALASYTEVTPSGTGVHILVQGALPSRGRRKGAVEMYAYARFFTMTGWHLAGTPPTIAARQAELTALHSTVFGPPQSTRRYAPVPVSSAPLLDDTILLDKARAAKNSLKFIALWDGDTSAHNDDDSAADMALCCLLAFWTQDPAQMDRLFRQSGLMRAKWDEQRGTHTYGERTIMEALARQTEHYRAPGEAQRRRNGQVLEEPPVSDAHPVILTMDEITTQPIEWVWWPYIAVGKLCIFDGDPGVGKTLTATQLAANLSCGYPLPDQLGKPTLPCGGPAITLLIATEDGLADTIKPRLERAGADCRLVKVFNEWLMLDSGGLHTLYRT